MTEVLVVSIGAYLTVLVQVGLFGAWPLLGGQPHLIALGSVLFPLFHRPVLGLWWIVIGGSLVDLLLPAHFGSTAVPLLLAYLVVAYATRRVTETLSWWVSVALGMLLLLASELPLTLYTKDWRQLLLDLGAGLILMIPICTILAATGEASRSGRHVSI